MRKSLSLGACLALASTSLLLGCGPADVEEASSVDRDTTALVSITTPSKLEGVFGDTEVRFELTLANEVQRIELFALGGEAPLATCNDPQARSLVWGTGNAGDGINEIFLRVTDAGDHSYDSEPVSVIVVNAGQPAYLLQGADGEITIPSNYDGSQEVDTKHHWNMPYGMHRLVAVMDWVQPEEQVAGWGVEIAIGTGICPHRGQTWGDKPVSQESPLMAEVQSDSEFPYEQWFVHLRPINPLEHLGEGLPYKVRVFLFPN